jgi:peptide/nickel transport system ATP-binding protein
MKELLKVKGLKKYFPITGGLLSRTIAHVRAVDDVSFNINAGETFALVGESGSGKTTTGKCILKLYEPTAGEVMFEGKDILKMRGETLRRQRREMQIIFQDPFGSLNRRMPVGDIIGEPLVIHGLAEKKERERIVQELMEVVGLRPEYLYRYPHEFSGGQRQRIGIARSIILNPKFIVCDEPVSALDVSIQSQIINLMQELQEKLNLTYLFIAHDLAVVRHMSDKIAVMYLGKIVEIADGNELFNRPLHPYTRALLNAIPIPDPDKRKDHALLEGDIPSPVNPPSGCRFHTRCEFYQRNKDTFKCNKGEYPLVDVGGGHFTACPKVQE